MLPVGSVPRWVQHNTDTAMAHWELWSTHSDQLLCKLFPVARWFPTAKGAGHHQYQLLPLQLACRVGIHAAKLYGNEALYHRRQNSHARSPSTLHAQQLLTSHLKACPNSFNSILAYVSECPVSVAYKMVQCRRFFICSCIKRFSLAAHLQ